MQGTVLVIAEHWKGQIESITFPPFAGNDVYAVNSGGTLAVSATSNTRGSSTAPAISLEASRDALSTTTTCSTPDAATNAARQAGRSSAESWLTTTTPIRPLKESLRLI